MITTRTVRLRLRHDRVSIGGGGQDVQVRGGAARRGQGEVEGEQHGRLLQQERLHRQAPLVGRRVRVQGHRQELLRLAHFCVVTSFISIL